MNVVTDPVDIVAAFNFSYLIFKTRDEMRNYFARAREALNDGRYLVSRRIRRLRSRRRSEGEDEAQEFTYIWDQAEFEPVTGHIVCHIHFKFPDGSKIKNAFSYDWRLWTLAGAARAAARGGLRIGTRLLGRRGRGRRGRRRVFASSDGRSRSRLGLPTIVAEKYAANRFCALHGMASAADVCV